MKIQRTWSLLIVRHWQSSFDKRLNQFFPCRKWIWQSVHEWRRNWWFNLLVFSCHLISINTIFCLRTYDVLGTIFCLYVYNVSGTLIIDEDYRRQWKHFDWAYRKNLVYLKLLKISRLDFHEILFKSLTRTWRTLVHVNRMTWFSSEKIEDIQLNQKGPFYLR